MQQKVAGWLLWIQVCGAPPDHDRAPNNLFLHDGFSHNSEQFAPLRHAPGQREGRPSVAGDSLGCVGLARGRFAVVRRSRDPEDAAQPRVEQSGAKSMIHII